MEMLDSLILYHDKNLERMRTGFYHVAGEEVSPVTVYFSHGKIEQRIGEDRKSKTGLLVDNFFDGEELIGQKRASKLARLGNTALDQLVANAESQGNGYSERFKGWVDERRAVRDPEVCTSCCLTGCGIIVAAGALGLYGLYHLLF